MGSVYSILKHANYDIMMVNLYINSSISFTLFKIINYSKPSSVEKILVKVLHLTGLVKFTLKSNHAWIFRGEKYFQVSLQIGLILLQHV